MRKIVLRLWYMVYSILTLPLLLMLAVSWFLLGLRWVSIKPNGTLSKWYDETEAYKVIRSYKRNWRYVVSGEWRA